MVSYFDDLMANAVPQMMRAFGRTVTSYTSASGSSSTSIVIYIGAISTQTVETDTGIVSVKARPFSVLADSQQADFPGLATVQQRGIFTIDSQVWQIDEIRFQTSYEVHGTLTRANEQRTITPRGFRR